MTKLTRKILLVVATALAIPVIGYAGLVAYIFIGPTIEARLQAATFESTQWKTKALDGDVHWPTRLRMIDDLLKRDALMGANKNTVVELLGPPDDTNYFKDWSMVYWLGPERGFAGIDSEWLVLRLDKKNTVIEARIERD